MVTTSNEILIQRCVDGELSAEERRTLLTRIEQLPDGWKTLACAYMEDQLFAGAAIEASGRSASSLSILRPITQVPKTSRSWFAHPATSVVLLLCVAFLAGLLANGRINRPQSDQLAATNENAGTNITNSTLSGTGAGNSNPGATVPGTLVSDKPNYSVRFEADGMSPRELPIYEDRAAFLSGFVEHQRKNASGSFADEKDRPESRINFMRIRMDNGRTILVPYEGIVPRFQ